MSDVNLRPATILAWFPLTGVLGVGQLVAYDTQATLGWVQLTVTLLAYIFLGVFIGQYSATFTRKVDVNTLSDRILGGIADAITNGSESFLVSTNGINIGGTSSSNVSGTSSSNVSGTSSSNVSGTSSSNVSGTSSSTTSGTSNSGTVLGSSENFANFITSPNNSTEQTDAGAVVVGIFTYALALASLVLYFLGAIRLSRRYSASR
jgi:hypothetical protein